MSAALTLHPLFSDQAVLPRDVPLPVFGRSVPGQTIKISFAGQQVTARADSTGAWLAALQPVAAGGPHTLTVSMASRQLIRRDIYAGDVWLATGQANMDMPVAESNDARAVLAQAALPRLRLFTVPSRVGAAPEWECESRWEKCTAQKAATFSALGFHFGRMLGEALECPIGIIQATHPTSSGLAWVPPDTLRSQGDLAVLLRAISTTVPVDEKTPGALFNGMIAPLTLLPIRGVIAYQGENDLDRVQAYRAIFSAQIQGWRAAWRRAELPFIFVQLAGYLAPKSVPGDDVWAELREAQAQALHLPATAMAVAADRGDQESIRPRDKRAIAERLMLGALAVAYRRSMPYSGPIFSGHVVKGGAVCLKFNHAESGLRARQTGPLLGFSIAAADRVFRWADARIEDGQVVVSHPAIAAPVAVRYAWEAQPALTFENGAGLPAAPFRTDNWSGSAAARG